MKKRILLFVTVLLMLSLSVPAYADIAYDPIDTIVYGIGPILIALVIVIAVISLIAGIVLLIVFSVRKKKRRAAKEKKEN